MALPMRRTTGKPRGLIMVDKIHVTSGDGCEGWTLARPDLVIGSIQEINYTDDNGDAAKGLFVIAAIGDIWNGESVAPPPADPAVV